MGRFFDIDSPLMRVLTRLADTIFPVTIPLQQINLIPNSINTIDVLTTVKPLDMYVETVVPPDPDPDDPDGPAVHVKGMFFILYIRIN